MMAGTHKLIATNIYNNFDIDKQMFVSKRSYIWGNIKPDYISKYKLKKHYFNESIDMIIEIIETLSELSIDEIRDDIGIGKFSAALGVATHFICDYYCLAHYERWEFKNAIKKHVTYERELSKIAKSYELKNLSCLTHKGIEINRIRDFIDTTLELYSKDPGTESDLNFAYYVSNTIINVILDNIIENSVKIAEAI